MPATTSFGDAFQVFTDLVEELESAGIEVNDASSHEGDLLADEYLTIDLSAGIPVLRDIDTDGIEITSHGADVLTEGTVTTELSVRIPLDQEERGSDETLSDSAVKRVETEATEESIEPDDDEEDTNDSGATDETAEIGEDQSADDKPYHDSDRLREVYDEYDTFPEMTDALDVDVTPETIRTNMVKHGIHVPESSDSAADAPEADSPTSETTSADEEQSERQLRADGLSLPQHVTLDDFKEAVRTSETTYQVQQKLDTEETQTRQLLKHFNLLDCVGGRITTHADQETSRAEIDERIADSTATGPQ